MSSTDGRPSARLSPEAAATGVTASAATAGSMLIQMPNTWDGSQRRACISRP